MALIDHCIENLPEHPADQLAVPISDLAHRVLQLYWRQVRPFEGHDLRQSSGDTERIPRGVRALRAATPASSLSVAMMLRSEEHTSELQSLMRISYAVFCLKKKKMTQQQTQQVYKLI